MTLEELTIGQKGKITDIRCEGPMRRRMMDMGLLKGTEIELIGIAPLGDPLEIKLRGYKLSLRKADAALIEVSPEDQKDKTATGGF